MNQLKLPTFKDTKTFGGFALAGLLASFISSCQADPKQTANPNLTDTAPKTTTQEKAKCVTSPKDFDLVETITLPNGKTQSTIDLNKSIFLSQLSGIVEKAEKDENYNVDSPFVYRNNEGKVVRRTNRILVVLDKPQDPTCKPSDLTNEQIIELRKQFDLTPEPSTSKSNNTNQGW